MHLSTRVSVAADLQWSTYESQCAREMWRGTQRGLDWNEDSNWTQQSAGQDMFLSLDETLKHLQKSLIMLQSF